MSASHPQAHNAPRGDSILSTRTKQAGRALLSPIVRLALALPPLLGDNMSLQSEARAALRSLKPAPVPVLVEVLASSRDDLTRRWMVADLIADAS